MTVAELIAKLEQLDPTLPVVCPGEGSMAGGPVDVERVGEAEFYVTETFPYSHMDAYEPGERPLVKVVQLNG
jgi:hypothetical protein